IGVKWSCCRLGQHANHRIRLASQQNRLPRDIRVRAKSRAPQSVAQDNCVGAVRTIFVLGKVAPDERSDSQDIKIVSRNSCGMKRLHVMTSMEVYVGSPNAGNS